MVLGGSMGIQGVCTPMDPGGVHRVAFSEDPSVHVLRVRPQIWLFAGETDSYFPENRKLLMFERRYHSIL
ncbi:hypothetical protein ASJ83_05270 [Methanocorpusculum parvum]|uniref:Uncharacterized protein n=1 Tax=Methanocorpusculum parvum TaxID=2193 RepID=A0AAX0Q9C6_9EURY|nr:hypothetical protein ASJ83_05270 [Methanocorpusculum parvum]